MSSASLESSESKKERRRKRRAAEETEMREMREMREMSGTSGTSGTGLNGKVVTGDSSHVGNSTNAIEDDGFVDTDTIISLPPAPRTFPFADALRRAGKKQQQRLQEARSDTRDAMSERGRPTQSDLFSRRETKRKRNVANSVLEKVLANLGVLSEVKVGDKLDFTPTGAFVIQKPTWYSTAIRVVRRMDRWQTFDQVENLVGTAESIMDDGSLDDLRVREALVNSIHGLRNLQDTYFTDTTFRARMEVLLQRIELRYDAEEELD